MSADLRVTADLSFTVEVPAAAAGPTRCTGRVEAAGQDITVTFDPMPSLSGATTRPLVRPLANQLSEQGLTLDVVGPDGPLIRLGARARAPWWQVPLTHGRQVELVSARALLRSVGGPRVFAVALPPQAVVPALTEEQGSRRRRAVVVVRQALRRVTGRRR